jgi:hypothetical protein
MQLSFNSALLAYAADFTGKYGSDQGVEVAPLRPGEPEAGVTVSAFNRGAIGMIGFDPDGRTSERIVLHPSPELVKAARGIKSAERDVRIEGDVTGPLNARVTTYYKAHSTFKDFELRVSRDFSSYRVAVDAALGRWGDTPDLSSTAGRYDMALLLSAIKTMVDDTDSLVICGYDGGPLRLQREDIQIIVLLMPQAAEPIPPVPSWLRDYVAA